MASDTKVRRKREENPWATTIIFITVQLNNGWTELKTMGRESWQRRIFALDDGLVGKWGAFGILLLNWCACRTQVSRPYLILQMHAAIERFRWKIGILRWWKNCILQFVKRVREFACSNFPWWRSFRKDYIYIWTMWLIRKWEIVARGSELVQ